MKTLNQDDIAVGMYVAVTGSLPREEPVYGGFGFTCTGTRMVEDRSFQGRLYVVLGLDLPYVLAQCVVNACGRVPDGHWDWETRPVQIDMRQYKVAKVDDDYARLRIAAAAEAKP